MLFDVERYVAEMEDLRKIQQLKPPNNKVPAVNLSKLSFDKKVAPITLDIRFGDKFILRDKFDWDLMEPRLRPQDFARAMCNQLPFFKSDQEKDVAIEKMSNSILDQIQAHIDKNTFFPRVRFGKKEEDTIANDQVCVNCDSLLLNSETCAHCGFQYEKKPGPQPGPGTQMPESMKNERKEGNQNKIDIQDAFKKPANIGLEQKSQRIQESKKLNQDDQIQEEQPVQVIHVFKVPENPIEGQKQRPQTNTNLSWKDRLTGDYVFSGKEKKICKKCNEVNPFFKNECQKCTYKFPKTRGLNSSLNADNYTLYFWDMLHSEPIFSSLSKINDYLQESDFISVRDLYKKIKEILTQPNTERIFDITDIQLLELHDSIDEKFEWLLTDNELTDRIFNDATAQKTNRKRTKQVYYNFKDAQQVHDRKVLGMEDFQSNNFQNDDSFENPYKRLKAGNENYQQIQKQRPHNFESVKMQSIISNYNLLSQMGFLEQSVIQSETINKLVNEQEEIISSLIKRRGRPKKFDLTYEDMLNVEKWDDSKLVFQTGLPGLGGEKDEDGNDQGGAQGAGTSTGTKRNVDLNADVCGICDLPGKLICCDDCPSAFHADCLGYEKQCPRGKWKCYFCKVIKYGIRQVPRMAPNERPICDELGDNMPTWEDKACQMFDILKYWYCFRQFFEAVKLTPEQKETLQKKKFIDYDTELNEPKYLTFSQLYEKVDNNEKTCIYLTYEHLYEEIKTTLNVFAKGLDKRDQTGMCARASLLILEKLLEENEIFQYIKPSKKKINYRANQQLAADQRNQNDNTDQNMLSSKLSSPQKSPAKKNNNRNSGSNNEENDVQIDISEQENDYDEEEEFDQEHSDDEEYFSDIPKNELKVANEEQKKNSGRISTRRNKPIKNEKKHIEPNNDYDFDLNEDQNQNSNMQNFFQIEAEHSDVVINLDQDSNQLPFSLQSLVNKSVNLTPSKVNQNEGSVSVGGRVTRNRLRGLQANQNQN